MDAILDLLLFISDSQEICTCTWQCYIKSIKPVDFIKSKSYEIEKLIINFSETVLNFWKPSCGSKDNIDVEVTFNCEDKYNQGTAFYIDMSYLPRFVLYVDCYCLVSDFYKKKFYMQKIHNSLIID